MSIASLVISILSFLSAIVIGFIQIKQSRKQTEIKERLSKIEFSIKDNIENNNLSITSSLFTGSANISNKR